MKNKAAQELGRLGGQKKLEKYGVEEMKRMSELASAKRKKRKKK